VQPAGLPACRRRRYRTVFKEKKLDEEEEKFHN